jgi:hypothetical protein
MGACTLRIVSVSINSKATSLTVDRAEHAAWCMPSPHAPLIHIKPLEPVVDRDALAGAGETVLLADPHAFGDES